MPELPEVETVRRGLEPVMAGARIVAVEQRRPDLRFPFPENFAGRLTGRLVEAVGRRAKYLMLDLEGGDVLVMHLGMSGSFRIGGDLPGLFHHDRSKDPAHDHVMFQLSNGAEITYNDPRRFGFMLLEPRAGLATHKFFRDIGVEPLGNELDGALLILDGPSVDAVEVIFRGTITFGSAAISAASGDAYLAEAHWFNRTALPTNFRPAPLRQLLSGSTPLAALQTIAVGDWIVR
jgi:hypothetical protein